MLIYKEELLTDVNNLLYRRTDDVERLQKVIGDTERQFVDCLQQIKALGEKDEQRQKELEDLRGAARGLVEDPSRMCAEELGDDAALGRVKRILLDVDAVPYVPAGFTAQNRPPSVSVSTSRLPLLI
jgi:hypothetical protein